MKNHFLPEETPENNVRYIIYQLMDHFEKIDDVISKLLSFNMDEKKALDQIEDRLIQMEKLHLEMTKEVKKLEQDKTVGDQIMYESSGVHEAIRRTHNLLSGLNTVDLNSEAWIPKMTRALIDKIYYRQIKALVFKKTDPTIEEI